MGPLNEIDDALAFGTKKVANELLEKVQNKVGYLLLKQSTFMRCIFCLTFLLIGQTISSQVSITQAELKT